MNQAIAVINYALMPNGQKVVVGRNPRIEFPDGGVPAGGTVQGTGIDIRWQDGALGRGDGRQEANGAFIEGVIAAAVSRLELYQASRFNCRENAIALTHLETALLWLNKRTQDRENRQVEGTHVV